jgi:hypothetical protein
MVNTACNQNIPTLLEIRFLKKVRIGGMAI